MAAIDRREPLSSSLTLLLGGTMVKTAIEIAASGRAPAPVHVSGRVRDRRRERRRGR